MDFGGGDTNLYAYVGNDPLYYRDPLGLIKRCIRQLMLVTSYNDIGPGSDWSYFKPKSKGAPPASVGPGTVAVANTKPKPFPYGSSVSVYNSNGSVSYQGEVRDTGAGWDINHHNVNPDQWIDIWLPGNDARKWGKQWREVEICYDDGTCPGH